MSQQRHKWKISPELSKLSSKSEGRTHRKCYFLGMVIVILCECFFSSNTLHFILVPIIGHHWSLGLLDIWNSCRTLEHSRLNVGWMDAWVGLDWMGLDGWDMGWDYRGIRRKGFIFWNTRYPKYPKILKKFRVWIGYWKKFGFGSGIGYPLGTADGLKFVPKFGD